MEALIKVLRFSKDLYPEKRPRTCNFSLALLEKDAGQKLGSESIMIPRKVSVILVVSKTSPTDVFKLMKKLISCYL